MNGCRHSCQDVMIMWLAPKCRECTLFCQTLPLRNGHGVIDNYPRLQHDISANELLYALVFHICDFDNHASGILL